MSVKPSGANRVGQTYGERRQAEATRHRGEEIRQQADTAGLSGVLRKLRDFFTVDPRQAAAEFASNTKFLNGDNLSPYQTLTNTSRPRPSLHDPDLKAYLDRYLGAPAGSKLKLKI